MCCSKLHTLALHGKRQTSLQPVRAIHHVYYTSSPACVVDTKALFFLLWPEHVRNTWSREPHGFSFDLSLAYLRQIRRYTKFCRLGDCTLQQSILDNAHATSSLSQRDVEPYFTSPQVLTAGSLSYSFLSASSTPWRVRHWQPLWLRLRLRKCVSAK